MCNTERVKINRKTCGLSRTGPYMLELISEPLGSRATELLTFFRVRSSKQYNNKNENPQEIQTKP